jgi:hypothetical protein
MPSTPHSLASRASKESARSKQSISSSAHMPQATRRSKANKHAADQDGRGSSKQQIKTGEDQAKPVPCSWRRSARERGESRRGRRDSRRRRDSGRRRRDSGRQRCGRLQAAAAVLPLERRGRNVESTGVRVLFARRGYSRVPRRIAAVPAAYQIIFLFFKFGKIGYAKDTCIGRVSDVSEYRTRFIRRHGDFCRIGAS